MFAEDLIVPDSLRNLPGTPTQRAGYSLRVRLNWFRSLPLSCLEDLALSVDGVSVDAEHLAVRMGGEAVAVSAATERDDLWWSCREAPTVEVRSGAVLAPGPHDLAIELRIRIPYFPPAGPGMPWPSMYDRGSRTETSR